MLRRFALAAALAAILGHSRPSHGCGFIESAGFVVTLREDAAASKIILFGRLANGTQRFADLELYAMLLLGTLAIVWVRAAKRIRRPPPPPEA